MTRLSGTDSRSKARGRMRLLAAVLSMVAAQAMAQINTDNVLLMGRSAIGSDDYLTAIHYFNQVIEAKPFLNRPYYYRAYAKFCLDDFSGAEADCSKAIAINPYQVEVYQLRGLCRIRNENFAGAVEDYTHTLQALPDDQSARYNRGLCYLQLKEYDAAAADMDAILKKWPAFDRAYAIQAQICLEKKDTLDGIAWLDKLLARNPSDADAWGFKGRYALNKGDYAQADSFLTKAIAYRPSNYEGYLARALARHGLNRFGAAIADYDKVIELVPQHFVAHYNRGLLRALVGENNRAIEDFSFVIAREPDNTLAIYNRALLRQQTGDYQGAIADYTRLIRQFPGFLYGYAARAECRRRVGNIRGALDDESVVARANLDITFTRQRRRPIKRVRRSSEHDLDQYEQLVDDSPADSTTTSIGSLLAADLFGRVQDKEADTRPLPPFTLTFKYGQGERGYHSSGFMPEVAALGQRLPQNRLYFSAELQTAESQPHGDSPNLPSGRFNRADSLLLASVSEADTYNYASALFSLQQAASAASLLSQRRLIHLQRAAVLCRSYAAEQSVLAEKQSQANEQPAATMAAALAELKAAAAEAPTNGYIDYALGCVYLYTGDATAAVDALSRALKTDTRMPEAYYNRGIAFLRLGKKAEARADLSRAGELGLYRAYALLKQAR